MVEKEIRQAGAVKEKARIAVLVSGGGTNLQALIDAQGSIIEDGKIVLVISNNSKAFALERARAAGIPTRTILRKELGSQQAFEEAIEKELEACQADFLVLAGFMTILSPEFTKKYEGRIINVHPSLIPKYCGSGFYGLKVHQAVLAAGEKVTGATVHYVNEIPDGGEILLQKKVEVEPNDTPETLQKRVMEQAEWIILPQAVQMLSRKFAGKGGQKKGKAENGCRGSSSEEGEAMNIYDRPEIGERIRDNSYVGRGILLGKTEDGKKAVAAYFIMGRSSNSRNRIFREEGDTVTIYPFDESKVEDPSLIIYSPVRVWANKLIVTNGDQTDTIYEELKKGGCFRQALKKRKFEPDSPNFTPRISGMITFWEQDFSYEMSILKSGDEEGNGCNRYTFDYEALPGTGHLLHTYMGDGNPLPTFQGEPRRVAVPDSIDQLTKQIWENLNEENKISLYVRYVDLASGQWESRLINKNEENR